MKECVQAGKCPAVLQPRCFTLVKRCGSGGTCLVAPQPSVTIPARLVSSVLLLCVPQALWAAQNPWREEPMSTGKQILPWAASSGQIPTSQIRLHRNNILINVLNSNYPATKYVWFGSILLSLWGSVLGFFIVYHVACSLLPCLSLFPNVNLVCHYRVTMKRCGCSVWQHVYSRCIFVLKARCNVSSQGKEEWPLVCLDILQSVLPFLFPVRLKTCWWWLKVLQFLLSLVFFLSYFRNKKEARKV